MKLASDALATKSKDLQIAVWLGEAYIKREGAAIIQPVLRLLLELQKEFWPTIYPEVDEGDTGLRAVPLQWGANRYATLVYELSLTKSGITYHAYKSARALGYEADARNNEAKTKSRAEALKRGNLTAEDVDDGLAASPKSFYAALDASLQGARDVLEDLAIYCEEQYGEDGPSYRKLRDSLEEVHNVVNSLLSDKREIEPDAVVAAPVAEPEPVAVEAPVAVAAVAGPPPVATATPAAATTSFSAAAPQSWDDAVARVEACVAYMHSQRLGSSVPYLMQTAIRWGELRKLGANPPLDALVAPPSEIRSGMKLAFSEKAWADLLSRGMAALHDPSARAWLDLHRYLWVATKESGYAPFSAMVLTSVRGILADYPDMPQWTFLDDTATANADTLRWIDEIVLVGVEPQASNAATPPPALAQAPMQIEVPVATGDGPPDAFIEAASLAAAGKLGAATALLSRDASQQPSGRMRYSRRMQIAELCLAGGNTAIATPILRELIDEMERRNLESWEAGDLITKPLAMLLRSQNGSMDAAEREALFTRLCRLDPSVALGISG